MSMCQQHSACLQPGGCYQLFPPPSQIHQGWAISGSQSTLCPPTCTQGPSLLSGLQHAEASAPVHPASQTCFLISLLPNP